jgi:hypothetical protein
MGLPLAQIGAGRPPDNQIVALKRNKKKFEGAEKTTTNAKQICRI